MLTPYMHYISPCSAILRIPLNHTLISPACINASRRDTHSTGVEHARQRARAHTHARARTHVHTLSSRRRRVLKLPLVATCHLHGSSLCTVDYASRNNNCIRCHYKVNIDTSFYILHASCVCVFDCMPFVHKKVERMADDLTPS